MTDNDFTLQDRLGVIRDTIKKFGEENFYISFSGGKDSTILSKLVDMAVPGNAIPRVFFDTGIEYNAIREFVSRQPNVVVIKPTQAIKPMLEKYGYPFKSKEHSHLLMTYQHSGFGKSVRKYLGIEPSNRQLTCPLILRYQFSDSFKIKVSDKCCFKMKKEVAHRYEKESGRNIPILGIRMDEGGERACHKGCAVLDSDGSLRKFKPLNPVSDDWEDWFAKTYDVELCELYYPPYNFKRTGCKGCPYSLDLEHQLEVMARLMPNERKQCEIIWKPVYDEYRRLGYRLKKTEQIKLF